MTLNLLLRAIQAQLQSAPTYQRLMGLDVFALREELELTQMLDSIEGTDRVQVVKHRRLNQIAIFKNDLASLATRYFQLSNSLHQRKYKYKESGYLINCNKQVTETWFMERRSNLVDAPWATISSWRCTGGKCSSSLARCQADAWVL